MIIEIRDEGDTVEMQCDGCGQVITLVDESTFHGKYDRCDQCGHLLWTESALSDMDDYVNDMRGGHQDLEGCLI
ncbi:MAG: hypothetical protein ABSD38_20970 [Syntrophorhabdales bacterium]|jgi:predicted RNA-binding Zn-ribbon protein involved in translation (DUF1610 family)